MRTIRTNQTQTPKPPAMDARSPTSGNIDWLQKARALQPVIEQYRDQAEAERHLPMPVFEAMQAGGFFHMWQPRSIGGYGASRASVIEVIEEVSRYDASMGWNLAIGIEGGAVWGFIPDDATRRMLGNDTNRIIAGSVNPARARAVEVDGGYRLTGQWPFASGCHQASFLVAAAVVQESATPDSDPRFYPNGEPEVRVFILPRDSWQIVDNWHVTGLRGTGSCDVAAEDVFVPTDQHFVAIGPESTPPHQPDGLYSAPLPRILGFVLAAVALGIARDAIDSFKEVAAGKTPFAASTRLQQQHTVHLRLGQAEATLRAGRELLYATAHRADTASAAGLGVDDELFADMMLARAHAASAAVDAVELILDSAGTSSLFEGSRLERCSRDIRAVPRHYTMAESNLEMAGQYLLGGPLQIRR